MPKKITMLLVVPRSGSTVTERAFKSTGYFSLVRHEPNADCYYKRVGHTPEGTNESEMTFLDYPAFKKQVLEAAQTGRVFVKDMVHYFYDDIANDPVFAREIDFVLLIREPSQTIRSYLSLDPMELKDFRENAHKSLDPLKNDPAAFKAKVNDMLNIIDSADLNQLKPHVQEILALFNPIDHEDTDIMINLIIDIMVKMVKIKEVGFQYLALFADKLKSWGHSYTVVDYADMVADPEKMLFSLCKRLDLPYKPGMHLLKQPDEEFKHQTEKFHDWHVPALNTTQIQAIKTQYKVELSDPRVQQLLVPNQPFYLRLKEQALKPVAQVPVAASQAMLLSQYQPRVFNSITEVRLETKFRLAKLI